MDCKMFAILVFICTLCCCSQSMEMYSFNVGPGCFTLFKYKNRAFIVDCGSVEPSTHCRDDCFRQYLCEILSNVEHMKIVITHGHHDHYNLFESLFSDSSGFTPVINDTSILKGVLFCGDGKNAKLADKNYIQFVSNIARDTVTINGVQQDVQTTVKSFLRDALFDNSNDGYIKAYLEDMSFVARQYKQTHKSKNMIVSVEHDINIVYKVAYRSKICYHAVLLPGDASNVLLNDLIMLHSDFFDDVRIGLMSHHGSITTGQECLLPHYKMRSIITIISSFPQSSWYLPKNIGSFLQSNRWDKIFAYVIPHTVCYADVSHNIIYCPTETPVFITSEHMGNSGIGIKCEFGDVACLLRYVPSNEVKCIGYNILQQCQIEVRDEILVRLLLDFSNFFCNYVSTGSVNIPDSHCTACVIASQDVLNNALSRGLCAEYAECILKMANISVYEQRCVLSPIEDEDIAEAEDVRDIALHNECCLLL